MTFEHYWKNKTNVKINILIFCRNTKIVSFIIPIIKAIIKATNQHNINLAKLLG